MSVKLTFDFDDMEAARDFLMKHTDAPAKVEETAAAPATVIPASKKATKKTTKKTTKKEAKKGPKEPEYTVVDARAALGIVVEAEKGGYDKGVELLKAYNSESVSALDPERYPDFIQACKAFEED